MSKENYFERMNDENAVCDTIQVKEALLKNAVRPQSTNDEAILLAAFSVLAIKYTGGETKEFFLTSLADTDVAKCIELNDDQKQDIWAAIHSFQQAINEQPDHFASGICIHCQFSLSNGKVVPLYMCAARNDGGMDVTFRHPDDEGANLLLSNAPKHWEHVLTQICQKVNLTADIELITEEEKEQIREFNRTELPIPDKRILHEIFRDTVERYPDSPAVVHHPPEHLADEQLTYLELDKRTDAFAALLREKGIGRGSIVPVIVERNIHIVVGIYAIMKAGGAWVAIDPKYPQERKQFIIEDCNASLILTQTSLMEPLKTLGCTLIPLDQPLAAAEAEVSNLNEPDDPALVIYTSGSTGAPKGSLLTHDNLARLYYREQAMYHVDNQNHSAEYAAFTFDIAFHALILHLLAGACVHILSEDIRYSLVDLEEYIEEYKIDYMVLPTQIGESFIMQCDAPSLKVLTVGGEKLRVYRDTAYKIINAYGPSECTVYTTQYEVTELLENIPLGKPIYNNKVYIVDPQGHLCPVGIAGELCVSGKQLSKGYLNRPDLTEKKFVQNPFETDKDYQRMYRSGDLAKWLPDGTIEFVGRVDYQVKVRGYRIELGEIETAIRKNEQIQDAVVIARKDRSGNNYLTAYYISKAGIRENEIIAYLETSLPEYMVPTYFMEMDRFPLSQNGKVDRKAFPEITFQETAFVKPESEFERTMARIWEQALNIPTGKVSIQDNFFHIGGDSIKAIQAVSLARREGYAIKVKDLFDCLTIETLEKRVDGAGRPLKQSVEQKPASGKFDLIPIQHWFFERAFEIKDYWNQSVLIMTEANLDPKRLEMAVEKLIQKHDALRLCFKKDSSGLWYQEYTTEPVFTKPPIYEAEYVSAEKLEALKDHWQSHFDIEHGPIVSIGIIHNFPDGQDRIFMAIHHLVVDGISWRIIQTDLENLYHGTDIGDKTSSFKDWYETLLAYGQSRKLKQQQVYWEKIDSKIKQLGQPPMQGQSKKQRYTCEIDKKIADPFLSTCNTAYNTQINDLLLTAFAGALCQWQGTPEIAINMEGHGREEISDQVDISSTVGWFTTQYPVYLQINGNDPLATQIKSVKEQIRKIPDKGIGYGVLRYLASDPSQIQEDCWVSFNYLGSFHSTKENHAAGWHVEFEGNLDTVSSENHDGGKYLDVNGWETEAGMCFSFDFNTAYLSDEDVKQIAYVFCTQVERITKHCASVQPPVFTASDYGFSQLQQQELEEIVMTYGKEQIEDIYPVSPLQEGFLFHAIRYPKSDEYFVQIAYDIIGEIDRDIYEEAWRQAMRDNSILRTAFDWSKSELLQVVYKDCELCVRNYEFQGDYQEDTFQAIRKRSRSEAFELNSTELTRLDFIQFRDRMTVIFNQHHIINDGWGVAALLQEVEENYQAIRTGKTVSRKKTQYGAYIRAIANGDFYDKDWEYWNQEMQGLEELPQLQIFNDGYKVGTPIIETGECRITLEQGQYESLIIAAKQYGVTASDLMLGAWMQLIQEYSQSQIAGTAVTLSGREVAIDTIESMVGLFINTVPLFVDCTNGTIKEYLDMIHHKVRAMNEHCHIGLSEIQKMAGSETALVNALYAYNHFQEHCAQDHSYQIRDERSFEKIEYPLCVLIEEMEQQITINISYDKSALNEELISHVAGHYLTALTQICNPVIQNVSEIEVITKEEREKVLSRFNNTKEDAFPTDQMFHSLFQQVARQYPTNIAVTFNPDEEEHLPLCPQTYTYEQLDEMSGRFASYLRELGVQQNTIVPVIVDRNADILIAALAIIKAGGAYLPIEAAYPEKRIRYMVEESGAKLFVTQSWCAYDCDESLKRINIDQMVYENYDCLTSYVCDPTSLFAVLYTSGTTGNPKGIKLSHRNVINMASNENQLNQITQEDKVAVHASITFDPFLMMGIAPLLNGACIQIMPQGVRKSIDRIHAFLTENRTTVTFLTTQLCELYASEYDNQTLKLLVTGGEKLFKCPKRHYKIANGYGPTEDCVFATQFLVDRPYSNIPIGKPMGNNRIYITDRKDHLCPVGIPGEICISGRQLSQGYLNQPELTEKQFVPNPYNTDHDPDYDRMYKTGDLGRWLTDGNIEILGRTDFQVKVRGYRIETDEIEKTFFKWNRIKDAIVISRTDRFGRNYLVGYYIPADQPVDETELRSYLQERLPDYMVPQYLIPLESLPVNANGKVDRRQLPAPEIRITRGQLPKTETEKQLAAVWSSVLDLKLESIGKDDSYFSLGGNSIKVILLSSSIKKEFGVELSVVELFHHKTIESQALLIEKRRKAATAHADEIKHLPLQNSYVLSNAQKRVDLAHKLRDGQTAYNMPLFIEFDKTIDVSGLEDALTLLSEKQWALRTYFQMEGQQLRQYIQKTVPIKLEIRRIRNTSKEALLNAFVSPFDLDHGTLLWRAILFEVADTGALILALDFHHSIFDGTSRALFLEHLEQAFNTKQLPEPTVQFVDYAQWEASYMQSEAYRMQGEYWKKELDSELPVLNLPTDFKRRMDRNYDAATEYLSLPPELMRTIQATAEKEGTTPFVIMLSAFAVLLSKYAGQEDLIIGIPALGRDHPSLTDVIGMFVGTLPIRLSSSGEQTIYDYFYQTRDKVVGGLNNQMFALEDMIESLQVERIAGHNALFDVMFALWEQGADQISLGDVRGTSYSSEEQQAKYDLTFYVNLHEENSFISAEYAKDLFRPSTIKRMLFHYQFVLEQMLAHPEEPVCSIELMTSREKQQQQQTFNATELCFPAETACHKIFQNTAKRYPQDTAIVYEGPSQSSQRYSYEQVDLISDRLAEVLQQKGVKRGDLVPILVERNADIIIGALGVMKAGGAWLAIDPKYPQERKQFLIQDCGASLICTQSWLKETLSFAGVELLCLDNLPQGSGHWTPVEIGSSDSAVVVYTSGSTGRPKGSILTHGNLANFYYDELHSAGIKCGQRSAEYAAFTFDISLHTLLCHLMAGAEVHILPEESRYSLS